MKLFVTGGTGFVGAHFLQQAAVAGHQLVATRRPQSVLPPAHDHRITWLPVALDGVTPAQLAGCDALVHFAAVGVSPKSASRANLTYWNVGVPQQLLEAAHAAGVLRVVMAGSSAEYGLSADSYELIPADAPLLPTTGYASSKAACFVSSHAAALELGLDLRYLRIFSAFGPGQFESNFWPALRKAALAGEDFPMTPGEQVRDFVDVAEVARVFLRAATDTMSGRGKPVVCNVGSGAPTTMRDFAHHWWQHWQARGRLLVGALPYRPNEVMRFAPLIDKELWV